MNENVTRHRSKGNKKTSKITLKPNLKNKKLGANNMPIKVTNANSSDYLTKKYVKKLAFDESRFKHVENLWSRVQNSE